MQSGTVLIMTPRGLTRKAFLGCKIYFAFIQRVLRDRFAPAATSQANDVNVKLSFPQGL